MVESVDIMVLGGGPGGLTAATTLALRGREVVVVNDGHLMGYGIEGAFKSKAEFEIARHFLYAVYREDVFGHFPRPNFEPYGRGSSGPRRLSARVLRPHWGVSGSRSCKGGADSRIPTRSVLVSEASDPTTSSSPRVRFRGYSPA